MDIRKNEEFCTILEKINQISKKLDKNYKKMKEEIITTPSSIIDSFDKYEDPQEKLSHAIRFFDHLNGLIKCTEGGLVHLDEFKKSKQSEITLVVPLITIYDEISGHIQFLYKHPKISQIRKYILLAEDTQDQIYFMTSSVFLRTVEQNFPSTVPRLDILSKFLVQRRDKTEIVERFIEICVKKLSFRESIEDDAIFLKRINQIEKDLEMIKELNDFLFDDKLATFLNQNLINILSENVKTDILRFIQLKDELREYKEIIIFLKLYSRCKRMKIDLIEYINAFLEYFFDAMENQTTLKADYGPEDFVLFCRDLFEGFTDELISDIISSHNETISVKDRQELEDTILLTALSKVKHLCQQETKLNQYAYIMSNLFELSQIKKDISDIVLFDEIKNYKKKLLEELKDIEIDNKSSLTSIIVQICNWNMRKEIKNSLIENIKKILKQKASKIVNKIDYEQYLSKLDR